MLLKFFCRRREIMDGPISSENDFDSIPKDDKCEFVDPNISYNFSFEDKKVYIIDDDLSAENALHILQIYHILYVDCIGENFGSPNVKLGLVQIAISSKCCFIFTCKCKREFEVLKEVLEDETIKKVFHDCAQDIAALALATIDGQQRVTVRKSQATGFGYAVFTPATIDGQQGITVRNFEDIQVFHDCAHDIAALALATIGGQQGITVRNFEDIQIAQLFVRKRRNLDLFLEPLTKLSLSDLYTYCFGGDFPQVYTGQEQNLSRWISTVLDERKIQHAALQVLLLERMYLYFKNIDQQWNVDGYKNMVAEVARR